MLAALPGFMRTVREAAAFEAEYEDLSLRCRALGVPCSSRESIRDEASRYPTMSPRDVLRRHKREAASRPPS